jgi:hypothetical protein
MSLSLTLSPSRILNPQPQEFIKSPSIFIRAGLRSPLIQFFSSNGDIGVQIDDEENANQSRIFVGEGLQIAQ